MIAPLALIMLISGMANSGSEGAWARVKAKIVGAFVQECPPEIAACEVCRRLRCESPEWIACERRLKAEHYLRTGDHASVEKFFGTLKRSYGLRRLPYFNLPRNAAALALACFAYNLRRWHALATG